jgi:hypothetical protein
MLYPLSYEGGRLRVSIVAIWSAPRASDCHDRDLDTLIR